MPSGKPNWANKSIWTADNLPIMRGMNSDSVDLIYLDPPFNSNADYAAPIGSKAAGAAFRDTWNLTDIDIEWITLIAVKHPALQRVLLAAPSDSRKSYLAYMAVRLLEMHRILKPTGSIYLHCDPTMSHHLKLVMDAIFGYKNFRNEIVWSYGKWSNAASFFQRNHDVILTYSKTERAVFNRLYALSEDMRRKLKIGWQVNRPGGVKQLIVYDREKAKEKIREGGYDRIVYRDEVEAGALMSDTWSDINILNSQSKERTGYPTQKPLALLRRIVEASSNEGDMVFDPFCGCATTLAAADALGRDWVGIDISEKAAELIVRRIEDQQGLWRKITHRTDIPKRTDFGKLPPPKTHRHALYGKQAGYCAACEEHFELRNMQVDHIIAKSKGGTDHIDNLQLLCGGCNSLKGDRGMEYLRLKLQITAPLPP